MALESAAIDVAVNTSGPDPVTTLELVRLVAELSGRPDLQPELVQPEPGKVRLTSGGAFRINHSAARDAIGWAPQVDMREGLRRTARLARWHNAQPGRLVGQGPGSISPAGRARIRQRKTGP
jgi:UDP-glucose 4-epimerase